MQAETKTKGRGQGGSIEVTLTTDNFPKTVCNLVCSSLKLALTDPLPWGPLDPWRSSHRRGDFSDSLNDLALALWQLLGC